MKDNASQAANNNADGNTKSSTETGVNVSVEVPTESSPKPDAKMESEVKETQQAQNIEPEKIDNRVVTIDKSRLDVIISTLIKETDDFTVSALENVYSKLIRIIWECRESWDKSDTLTQIESYVDKLSKRHI